MSWSMTLPYECGGSVPQALNLKSEALTTTPKPLYNTIAGVKANVRVRYPFRVITRVKCIDI